MGEKIWTRFHDAKRRRPGMGVPVGGRGVPRAPARVRWRTNSCAPSTNWRGRLGMNSETCDCLIIAFAAALSRRTSTS